MRTLVVCLNVSKVVATTVVRLPNAHRVVCEVDITIVACGLLVGLISAWEGMILTEILRHLELLCVGWAAALVGEDLRLRA
jgi:hypothetical protein